MMASAVKPGAQTPTDQLRTLLAQSEDRIVKLSGREAAAEFFFGLDRLVELWPRPDGAVRSGRASGVHVLATIASSPRRSRARPLLAQIGQVRLV